MMIYARGGWMNRLFVGNIREIRSVGVLLARGVVMFTLYKVVISQVAAGGGSKEGVICSIFV